MCLNVIPPFPAIPAPRFLPLFLGPVLRKLSLVIGKNGFLTYANLLLKGLAFHCRDSPGTASTGDDEAAPPTSQNRRAVEGTTTENP